MEEQGAFFKSRKCAYGWSMTLAKRTNRSWFWRCNSRSCKCKRSQISFFDGSFFGNRKAPINKVLLVLYLFLQQTPLSKMVEQSEMSKPTVSNIVKDILQVMEAGLKIEDVSVGK